MTDSKIPALPFTWKPQNNMLICSLAIGPRHIALMRVMAPTVAYYALQHKMDSLVLPLHDRLDPSRPPAWDKLILIRHALTMYDTVMWIDADAIICDPTKDIREVLDNRYAMHLVAHRIGRRTIPNTGVWVCQRSKDTFELLEAVWKHSKFVNHNWWEQAALMDLIGYDLESRTFQGPTSFSSRVRFIGHEWNSRNKDSAEHPIIYHYCNQDKPIEEMERKYLNFMRYITKINKR